jgi:tRNA(adenine34) deaminase
MNKKSHEEYMRLAIGEAKKAGQNGEVPIGAILVAENGEVISSAHNRTISLCDPSAHAEILVLRNAGIIINNYRLLETILYVTIEPCIMCMGAVINSRIKRVVFGTYDPKGGAAGSLYNFAEDKRLNHRTGIISGICEEECRSLIQEFFKKKRG